MKEYVAFEFLINFEPLRQAGPLFEKLKIVQKIYSLIKIWDSLF